MGADGAYARSQAAPLTAEPAGGKKSDGGLDGESAALGAIAGAGGGAVATAGMGAACCGCVVLCGWWVMGIGGLIHGPIDLRSASKS